MIVHPPLPPHPDVCTWSASPSEMIGLACPNCGHTNLVHGSPQNKLNECALCRLILVSRQVTEQLLHPKINVTFTKNEGEKGDESP